MDYQFELGRLALTHLWLLEGHCQKRHVAAHRQNYHFRRFLQNYSDFSYEYQLVRFRHPTKSKFICNQGLPLHKYRKDLRTPIAISKADRGQSSHFKQYDAL